MKYMRLFLLFFEYAFKSDFFLINYSYIVGKHKLFIVKMLYQIDEIIILN